MKKLLIIAALILVCVGSCYATCPILNTSFPNAPQGQMYPSWDDQNYPWMQLRADTSSTGCNGSPTSWNVYSGALPPGLAIYNDSAHVKWYIAGTATGTVGTNYSFVLQALGPGGYSLSSFSITVTQPNPTFLPALNSYTDKWLNSGGTYLISQPNYLQVTVPTVVVLHSTTTGAHICYTLNSENVASEPTTDGNGNCTGTTLDYSVTGSFTLAHSTLVRAVATKSGLPDSNVAPGYIDVMEDRAPDLPAVYIPTLINTTNYSCLLSPATPVYKTVKASGGNYTTIAAAFAAIPTDTASYTLCEIIDVDPESTGFLTAGVLTSSNVLNYRYAMPANKSIWLRSAGYSLLPPQGSDTRSCTAPDGNVYGCPINHSDRPNMFKVSMYTTSTNPSSFITPFRICGDIVGASYDCPVGNGSASGLLITGMDVQFYGANTSMPFDYIYDAIIIGDYDNIVGPSRIFLDRIMVDTVSNNFDTYLRTAIQVEGGSTIAVTDSYVDHEWEPANLYGQAIQGQAFGMIAGPGPVKLFNNWFGGTAVETIMFGGSTGGIVTQGTNLPQMGWPHDIEVRRNILTKNPAVIGPPNSACIIDGSKAGLANLFEFKGGEERLLLEANVMLYSYSAGITGPCYQQNGNIIAMKEDQNGPPWCELCADKDVTIRYNDLGHANICFETLGHDQSGKQYPSFQRISYQNNRCFDMNHNTYGGTYTGAIVLGSTDGSSNTQAFVRFAQGPSDVTMTNNAFMGTPTNIVGQTQLEAPLGGSFGTCNTPGDTYRNFIFQKNISVLDGESGTTAGQEIMNGACEQSPFIQLGNGVFPNHNFGDGNAGTGHTGNVMFNFKASSGTTCDTGTGYAAWGTGNSPGVCPSGLAASPTTINTALGIAAYDACAAGTGTGGRPMGTYASCMISGGFSIDGPDYVGMMNAFTLSEDYYAGGAGLLTITTGLLAPGVQLTPYGATLGASGGSGIGYTWSLTSGALPPGLGLSSGGLISGTPTTSGTYNFVVQVEDSLLNTATATLSIHIANLPLQITTTLIPDAYQFSSYNFCLGATGGGGGYAWGLLFTSLPTGLGLNYSTGCITGTPTVVGSTNIVVKLGDGAGDAGTTSHLTIRVDSPLSHAAGSVFGGMQAGGIVSH